MRVVRAEAASGRIVSVDCERASTLPGVFAVWTGKDVPAFAADRFS